MHTNVTTALLRTHLLHFDNALKFVALEVKNCLIHESEYWKLWAAGYGIARVIQGRKGEQPLAKCLHFCGGLPAHKDCAVRHDKCGARALKKAERLVEQVVHDHEPRLWLDYFAHEAAGDTPQSQPEVTRDGVKVLDQRGNVLLDDALDHCKVIDGADTADRRTIPCPS
jgi:hypothetical protein